MSSRLTPAVKLRKLEPRYTSSINNSLRHYYIKFGHSLRLREIAVYWQLRSTDALSRTYISQKMLEKSRIPVPLQSVLDYSSQTLSLQEPIQRKKVVLLAYLDWSSSIILKTWKISKPYPCLCWRRIIFLYNSTLFSKDAILSQMFWQSRFLNFTTSSLYSYGTPRNTHTRKLHLVSIFPRTTNLHNILPRRCFPDQYILILRSAVIYFHPSHSVTLYLCCYWALYWENNSKRWCSVTMTSCFLPASEYFACPIPMTRAVSTCSTSQRYNTTGLSF